MRATVPAGPAGSAWMLRSCFGPVTLVAEFLRTPPEEPRNGIDIPRRLAAASGPLRHAAPGRPNRRALRPAPENRPGRPRVHRADGHVLPRHGGRGGPAAVLLQGRRPRLREGAR